MFICTTGFIVQTFYFYVPHDQLSGLRLEMDAYDWDAVSTLFSVSHLRHISNVEWYSMCIQQHMMMTTYMRAGARDFIGDTMLLVEEMEPGLVKDMWVNLVGPAPTQKGLQKKLGKNMAEEGWAPKLPIVIVPGTLGRVSISLTHSPTLTTHARTTNIGFGSTGLEVIEGYEKWKGERVWLSISKIGGQALSIRSRLFFFLFFSFFIV